MNNTILALALVACSSALASPRLLEADDAPRGTGTAREKLVARLSLLEESRPQMGAVKAFSIGGLTAIAGGGLLLGLAVSGVASTGSVSQEGGQIAAFLFGFAGTVIVIAGGVLLVVALVKFLVTLHQQSKADAQISETKQRLEELDRAQVEGPLRSLNVERRAPPGFVLATF